MFHVVTRRFIIVIDVVDVDGIAAPDEESIVESRALTMTEMDAAI